MLNLLSRKFPQKPTWLSRLFGLTGLIVVLVIIAGGTGFALWSRSPPNLVTAGTETKADLLQRWQAGEIVALVRHAERCDRSSNPCLGPADGITQAGSVEAAAVGQGFQRLGLSQTDVLSSPVTRTVQTSHYMLGKDAMTQEWLSICGKTMRNDVVAHKVAHRNLVLVTHSGCIHEFEAQTGFRHAPKSEYGSSLFVRISADGQLKVLGIVKADDWHSLLNEK
ncbi:histidine phosphatase family protein [Pseudomonas sp. TH39(2020)]|uniref:Histidine phosphatase family protein n=1 Tax=Pseudomonas mandelii TaxID=75612 RepID=A0A502IEG9_9PSED|nr:histidine phosphatase family protein [Pseudomonas sp. TH39(2020)]TPG83778.1 histidine phosphatase family protein [Pseudomonas mandelii]TPG90796.1 histidine phosphatase family protein [Pseudomonas caspiana]